MENLKFCSAKMPAQNFVTLAGKTNSLRNVVENAPKSQLADFRKANDS